MARLRDGDEAAFHLLYDRHKDRVLAHAYRLVRNAEDAQDVLQEAFLYVFRVAPNYQPRAGFTTLLYRTVRSLCLDRLDRARRRRTLKVEVSSPPDPRSPDPLQQVSNDEERARLEKSVRELPAIYREVISLKLTGGLDYEQIGEIVGAPVGTVKSRVHHALERLRQDLAGEPRRPLGA